MRKIKAALQVKIVSTNKKIRECRELNRKIYENGKINR